MLKFRTFVIVMKQMLHKILSLLMAVVVLFSTMSFTISKHYCGDTLVDTAIFKKAKTCGMDMQMLARSSDCSVTKTKCCTEEQQVVNGQDELQLSIDKISFEQQVFTATYIHTYINLFEGLNNNITSYEKYEPPLVIRQLYKIDETYLI